MDLEEDYEDQNEEEEEYTYEEEGDYDDYDNNEPVPERTNSKTLAISNPNNASSSDSKPKVEQKKKITVPNDSYVMINSLEIVPIMNQMVTEVSSLLEISPYLAQSLLQYYKWDKERLIDNFFANPEKVKEEACLDKSFNNFNTRSPRSPQKIKRQKSNETFKCQICCDPDCLLTDSFCIGCGHRFCTNCYKEYLRNQVVDGPTCVIAHCPEPKCKQIITKDIFHLLLSPNDREKYDDYFLRNFIEKCKNMRHCPAPRCEKVAVGSGITTIKCTCNLLFCFRCGEEAHDPCSCNQLADWNEKCMNESETANWILANTQKCPACQTRIEKNQGCNHMTCRMCKHEFCWICQGDWKEHGSATGGYYKCNKFKGEASGGNEQQKAKAELDRYLHYYQRFHNHAQASKFANTQRDKAEKRMVEQQETNKASWIDVQFLKQAVEQVIECRRVLKYTYVLGYHLKDKSAEKELFEYHQEMLEKNTEKLQEYTEKNVELIDRTDVVNLTRITEKFMASLLANMTGGIVMLDEGAGIGPVSTTTNSNNDTNNNNNSNSQTKHK